MPRPPRVDYEDAWHHVMNRGAARQAIFIDEGDRTLFLECLSRAADETMVETHAYCLMSNHFHLLLRSREGRLSDFLKRLSGRYTRLVNKRSGRDGPLFRGRATSILIRDSAQLVHTTRYIHLNPVVAGLCRSAEDWRWSSARSYLALDRPASWLFTRLILDMFVAAHPGAEYQRYLREGVDLATADLYSHSQWNTG